MPLFRTSYPSEIKPLYVELPPVEKPVAFRRRLPLSPDETALPCDYANSSLYLRGTVYHFNASSGAG